jgi:hypothetical protein
MPKRPWEPLPEEAALFNDVYIDESSTKLRYLAIGGIICPRSFAAEFAADIIKARGSDLPAQSSDGTLRELKWIKVSDKKLDAYKRVVLAFFQFANKIPLSVGCLDFHSAIVDTSMKGGNLTEIGFNKEIRTLSLKFARLYPKALFHVYLDERCTSHLLRAEQYHLNNTAHLTRPNKNWPFRRMQFRKSHEVQGIQVADILLGALAFRLNGHYDRPEASRAKIELANYVLKIARVSDPFRDTKHYARYTIWHRDKPWLKPMLKASRSPTPFRVPPARDGSPT